MSIFVTVRFPLTPDDMAKFEVDNLHLHEPIMNAAIKYSLGHRRFLAEDHVLDIDEYATVEDYNAFFEVAKPLIEQYAELAGAPIVDTIYTELVFPPHP